jgi:hypothetical protein
MKQTEFSRAVDADARLQENGVILCSPKTATCFRMRVAREWVVNEHYHPSLSCLLYSVGSHFPVALMQIKKDQNIYFDTGCGTEQTTQ